ncbi:MAG: YcgN family cysteine cluster protein [Psittacicella sp.]
MNNNFWETKKLKDFSQDEWEAVCDRCGLCCYQKYIIEDIRKKDVIYTTSVACNLLNLDTLECQDYSNRLKKISNCMQITKDNIDELYWLPKTCSYYLLNNNLPLPSWHYLLTGEFNTPSKKELSLISIHEKNVKNWEDYIISYEHSKVKNK